MNQAHAETVLTLARLGLSAVAQNVQNKPATIANAAIALHAFESELAEKKPTESAPTAPEAVKE